MPVWFLELVRLIKNYHTHRIPSLFPAVFFKDSTSRRLMFLQWERSNNARFLHFSTTGFMASNVMCKQWAKLRPRRPPSFDDDTKWAIASSSRSLLLERSRNCKLEELVRIADKWSFNGLLVEKEQPWRLRSRSEQQAWVRESSGPLSVCLMKLPVMSSQSVSINSWSKQQCRPKNFESTPFIPEISRISSLLPDAFRKGTKSAKKFAFIDAMFSFLRCFSEVMWCRHTADRDPQQARDRSTSPGHLSVITFTFESAMLEYDKFRQFSLVQSGIGIAILDPVDDVTPALDKLRRSDSEIIRSATPSSVMLVDDTFTSRSFLHPGWAFPKRNSKPWSVTWVQDSSFRINRSGHHSFSLCSKSSVHARQPDRSRSCRLCKFLGMSLRALVDSLVQPLRDKRLRFLV